MKTFRIEFTRVQETYYEREVEARNFKSARRKFFREYGKQFGGKKEIRIDALEYLG